jgi:hypothetical protein
MSGLDRFHYVIGTTFVKLIEEIAQETKEERHVSSKGIVGETFCSSIEKFRSEGIYLI